MPALLINIVNGNWVAEVANTDISYIFSGESLAMQAQSVQNLSLVMELNDTSNLISLFNAPGVDSATLARDLFEGTDSLIYEGEVIYQTPAGISELAEVLEAAGEALAAV
jgi:hypothetical protein